MNRPTEGIAVDAAHSTKNLVTEFQGIDLATGEQIFYKNYAKISRIAKNELFMSFSPQQR